MITSTNLLTMLKKALPPDFNAEISVCKERVKQTKFVNRSVAKVSEQFHTVIRAKVEKRGKVGTFRSNRLTLSGLREALAMAAQKAEVGRPGPLVQMGSTGYRDMNLWFPATANLSAESRSEMLDQAMDFSKRAGLEVAGNLATAAGEFAIVNTAGLAAMTQVTFAEFRTAVSSNDAAGTGHGYHCARDIAKLDVLGPVLEAAAKCQASSDPRPLPWGEYTVILEPAAVADLLQALAPRAFSGHALLGQTPYKIGNKVFGENINIWDDALDPKGLSIPFDSEGVPKQRLHLVSKGVLQNLTLDNAAAAQLDLPVTGHAPFGGGGAIPTHLFMEPGNAMLDDMITSTKRGILVSRLRNILFLNPHQATGVTGNGTLLIENGKLKAAVPNLRFVQNLVQALNQVEMIGDEARLFGNLWGSIRVPGLKIHGFNITGAGPV